MKRRTQYEVITATKINFDEDDETEINREENMSQMMANLTIFTVYMRQCQKYWKHKY